MGRVSRPSDSHGRDGRATKTENPLGAPEAGGRSPGSWVPGVLSHHICWGFVMAKTKRKSGPTVRVPCGLLLDIEDELNDLTGALGCLSELRMMSSTMRDIIEPPRADRIPTSADRLGQCAKRFFGQRLDKHLDSAGNAFVNNQSGMVSPTDLAEAAEMIPAAVQWRLYRLQALIRLLKAER